jgi:hypothetical protein
VEASKIGDECIGGAILGGRERKYPASEYRVFDDKPLQPARLAQIWRGLPEAERYRFVISLDARLVDEVIVLTAQQSQEATP